MIMMVLGGIRAAKVPATADMSDADLRAMYVFIRSLGPAGQPSPDYVPPGQAVTTPYIVFVPRNLPQHAQAAR